MQSNGHSRTVGSQPAVRSACEPCHERKTRCIISRDGGSCDSCESRNLSCFFLPRARSGRRPITHHAAEIDGSSPSTNQSSSGGRPSQLPTPDFELHNNHFDWNWTLPAKCLDGQSQSTALLDLDRSLLSPRTTASPALQPPVTELDFPQLPQTGDQNFRRTERSTFPAMETPDPTKPLASDPSWDPGSRMGRRLGEKEFPTLIQLCSKLQKHVALTGDVASNNSYKEPRRSPMTPTISPSHLQEMTADIDRSCDILFAVYGQGILSGPTAQSTTDLDHASVSLAIALIFKIFQICDAVLSSNLLNNQGMSDLLLHKRLDFNLMQAKIVLSRIEELTQGGLALSRAAALSASYVENKFRAIS